MLRTFALVLMSIITITRGNFNLLDCRADLAFVLDSSGSVGGGNWALVRRFLQDFVSRVNFGPDKMQIGVVSFGNAAHLDVSLNQCAVPGCFKLAVRRIPYLDENTNTSGGIYVTRTQIFTPKGGDRPDAPNLMVILTDGRPTYDVNRTLPEARLAREAGIQILAVGVGYNISSKELLEVVEYKRKNLLYVSDFSDLLRSVGRILNNTCRIEILSTTPLPTTTTITTTTPTTTTTTTTPTTTTTTPTTTTTTPTTTTTTPATTTTTPTTTTTTPTTTTTTPTTTTTTPTPTTTTPTPTTPTPTTPTTATTAPTTTTPTTTTTISTTTTPTTTTTTTPPTTTQTIPTTTKTTPTSNTTTPTTTKTTTTTPTPTATPAQAMTPNITLQANQSTTGTPTTKIPSSSTKQITATTRAPTLSPVYRPPCDNVDFILLIDSSGSVQESNWDHLKKVAKVLASSITSDSTRMGVVSFSSEAFLNVQLGAIRDRAAVVDAIDKIPWVSQMTNISGAFRIARREMFGTIHDRQDAQNVVLVLTDGRANRDVDDTEPEASRLKVERGASIFTVGVGPEVDVVELRGIASDPDMFYMMLVSDFEELSDRTEEIFIRVCIETPPPVPQPRPWSECPFDLVFVLSNTFGTDSVDATGRYLLIYAVYNINFNTHRIGIVSTGAVSKLHYSPVKYKSRLEFYSYVDQVPNVGPTQPLDTDFRRALKMLREASLTGLGGPKVIVIIAPDGVNPRSLPSLEGDVRKAQEEGVFVYVISDLKKKVDLTGIVSHPSCFFIYSVEKAELMDICTIAGQGTVSCDFENKDGIGTLCDFSQSINDDFDWTLQTGNTPSRHTGPDEAYTGSYYIYVEASSPRMLGEKADLLVPATPDAGLKCLFFYYHMKGWHVGRLEVIVRSPSRVRDRLAWLLKGPQASSWKLGMVNLMTAPGGRVIFRAVMGGAFSGDIALDSIRLTRGACPRIESNNIGLVIQ